MLYIREKIVQRGAVSLRHIDRNRSVAALLALMAIRLESRRVKTHKRSTHGLSTVDALDSRMQARHSAARARNKTGHVGKPILGRLRPGAPRILDRAVVRDLDEFAVARAREYKIATRKKLVASPCHNRMVKSGNRIPLFEKGDDRTSAFAIDRRKQFRMQRLGGLEAFHGPFGLALRVDAEKIT